MPIIHDHHDEMSDANTQQYERHRTVPAPGRTKSHDKPNCQRHFGKCQVNTIWQSISLRVGQESIKDEDVRDGTRAQRDDVAASHYISFSA